MIGLKIIQSGAVTDVSELVSEVNTSGRKGAAGRTMTATLLDAPEFDRTGIDVFKGCQFIFTWDGSELMRGKVMEQTQDNSHKLQITGRDNLIYLANNSDTFSYTNKTASQIFNDLCSRFGITTGTVFDTSYVIPSVSIENGTIWDCLLKALSATYKATGARYYISSDKGAASLLRRRDTAVQWVIEAGGNLTEYEYRKSISDLRTRVKMLNDTGAVVAQAINAEVEKNHGIFQEILSADSEMNAAQLKALTDSTLTLKSAAEESFTVSGIGIPSVVSGIAVQIRIPDLSISGGFYVDEDSHTFSGEKHTMRLTITRTDELEWSD